MTGLSMDSLSRLPVAYDVGRLGAVHQRMLVWSAATPKDERWQSKVAALQKTYICLSYIV